MHEAYSLWREMAAREGYDLNTSDICPPQEADGLWLIDLPRKRKFHDALLRAKKRKAKVVLQVVESPLITPQVHVAANRAECDYVLTYSSRECCDSRYYHYQIPNYLEWMQSGVPFEDRRCAVMINSNKMEGWFGSGEVDSNRFPGAGKFINGWKTSRGHWLRPDRGELYSWRRKFARSAEEMGGRMLDIYGGGWQGGAITWLPVGRPKPYRCAGEGLLMKRDEVAKYPSKIPLMGSYRFGVAVENYRGNRGYISEKLFDVMRAGAVPVYLGEESIGDLVPPGAFVDVRHFRGHGDLWRYLASCSEREWQDMRAEGKTFLASERVAQFGVEAFADTAMKMLRKL